MEIEITVDPKGRVLIPKSIRKALGIEAGKPVSFLIEGNKATIKGRNSHKSHARAKEV